MAADGNWRANDLAADDVRVAVVAIEARLTAPGPPLSQPDLLALARALDALALRIAAATATGERRFAESQAVLRRLATQLEAQAAAQAATQARLDRALDDLAILRGAANAEPPLLRAALSAAATMALLSVVGAAVVVATQPERLPAVIARPLAALKQRLAPEATPAPSHRPPAEGPVATRPGAGPPARQDSYEAVSAALARGDATALARLTGLAEAGDGKAQLHLAALYETGRGGLPRDLASARAWTRRAALGGERSAMHNLALFLANGEGGPQDQAEAVQWFRRAAERGVVDSQYNLGLVYEAGRGAPRNLRNAYRWFSVAANAGDLNAREKQLALEPRLRPAERADVDREIEGFRPGGPAPADAATLIPPAATVAETQALLSRQGYYVGPVDGANSTALRTATTAWLRDHPATAGAVTR